MRGAVIITECNEGTHFQSTVAGGDLTMWRTPGIVHHRAVLTVDHVDRFLDLHVANGVRGDREWIERGAEREQTGGLFVRWPLLVPQLVEWSRDVF